MNSETSEGKEKRVSNPEAESVVSPLERNLFVYAGSFLPGNHSYIYCAGKGLFIIVVLLALRLTLSWMISYTRTHCGTSKSTCNWLKRPAAQYSVHCSPSAPIPQG